MREESSELESTNKPPTELTVIWIASALLFPSHTTQRFKLSKLLDSCIKWVSRISVIIPTKLASAIFFDSTNMLRQSSSALSITLNLFPISHLLTFAIISSLTLSQLTQLVPKEARHSKVQLPKFPRKSPSLLLERPREKRSQYRVSNHTSTQS